MSEAVEGAGAVISDVAVGGAAAAHVDGADSALADSAFADFGPLPGDVDRGAMHRGDAAYLDQSWDGDGARVVRFDADGIVVTGEPPSVLDRPRPGELRPAAFLGHDGDGVAYFSELPPSRAASTPVAPSGELGPRGLRLVLGALPAAEVRIAAYATALYRWHERHPHCARCGMPTEIVDAGHIRRCPSCGVDHYPRTDPAVIVLVTDPEDRALLGRQASWPAGRFSTLAGFVEPGESLEAAVVREVREESGVVVDSVRYVASQPWPFPASLMLGFFARAAEQPVVADGVELAEAAWFTRDELSAAIAEGAIGLPPTTSISRRLIDTWLLA